RNSTLGSCSRSVRRSGRLTYHSLELVQSFKHRWNPAMAIDLHAHYLPSELVAQLRARHHIPRIASGPEGKEHLFMPIGSLAFHDGYVNLEARLQYMDKVGVKRQVLSLPGLFGVDS